MKKPKIFFGWWTVLACGIIGFLGVGFGNFSFSVYFKPLSEEFGLSRAATSIASGLSTIMNGVAGPFGGWANDKYGPRRIMLIGISILTIGFVAMHFINSMGSYLITWGVLIGLGTALGPAIMTDRAIINWFVNKSGIAVNIKFAIQALAGITLLPLIAMLVSNQGWRTSCLIAAAVVFLVSVPLTWFFIRPHRPEYYGLLPDGDSKAVAKYQTDSKLTLPADRYELTEFTFRQTVRTSSYWLYIVIIAISNFCTPMMNVHFVPFLTDGGIEPIQAASMLGLIFTLNIPARLIGGFVADRVKTGQLRYIIALGVFLQACGVATYLVCRNIQGIYAWIILYGFGLGVAQSSLFPLIVRYFGRKAFGSITGLTAMLQMPVGLLSPIFIGWTYDNYGSYTHIIVIMAVVLTAGGIIAFFIRRPKLPELTSDTSETAR